MEPALEGELKASGAPPEMLWALRVLLGSAEEIESGSQDGIKLRSPASLATEERVWAALRGYCKMGRAAMGGPRNADVSAAAKARRQGEFRLASALLFKSEKKRLLSELENRLTLQAARSRRAGKVVK